MGIIHINICYKLVICFYIAIITNIDSINDWLSSEGDHWQKSQRS